MARVIDIDDLIDLDRIVVKIAGVEYRLPGDIPIPDYLALRRLFNQLIDDDAERDGEPDQLIEELHDRLLTMFQVHQPNMEELPFGPKTIVPVVFAYLNQNMGEQVEDDTPPPTRRASTKPKTSGSRRSTTRTQSR